MRKISRIAFLQDYTGHPENLVNLLDEVKGKGYSGIAIHVSFDEFQIARKLADEANARGLKVHAFTGYMKYQQEYLARHPEQIMILSDKESFDQDDVQINWGCPFNDSFKNRYLNFLKDLAQFPGLIEVWLNDEASLGTTESSFGCYCAFCKESFEQFYGNELPLKPDWENPLWKQFLQWRFESWNEIHGEMKKTLNLVNPEIKASFLTSPFVKLCNTKTWVTGIDLAGMAEHIDGIFADPYYTFHQNLSNNFYPQEVYLSEWCRFLTGIMPPGKRAGIIPQGFSHSTFSRPLGKEDGVWSSIIPPATGINYIAPYTYTLQKISPVQKSYEQCFKFDSYFEKNLPLKHAAIIHGFASEVFNFPLYNEEKSFDKTCILPCAESLRNYGTPYQYYPDRRINVNELNDYSVIILPEVSCLSELQIDELRAYWENGGNMVILGEFGTCNEKGMRKKTCAIQSLLGINILEEGIPNGKFELIESIFSDKEINKNIDAYEKYHDGIYKPAFMLNHSKKVNSISNKNITVAKFHDSSPAIIAREKNAGYGRIVYFAGIPSRNYYNDLYKVSPQNLSHKLFAMAVEWAAGRKSELFVEQWPPEVPMNRLRPCDPRLACTFEFFPSKGENSYLGVIASYFKEPAEFPLCLTIPKGKKLKRIKELISGQDIKWTFANGVAKISVEIDFDTPALIYLFELK